ncbi:site-specific integrase [Chitinophaga varians]|uniref:site-specific integrase n=1 Tax=Chitinophaga varians TaxID=2202339 RepID=UPI00165F2F1D|nr:site-specific integrase [Chitinophaga varians]MBC9909088.1 site-specific integrase [Chitinophaga varians]
MKVNEHLSVLFLLEKSKASSNGSVPITIRLTVDGVRSEMSLGQKILPSHWDQQSENVSLDAHPNKKEAALLYSIISQALNDLKTHYFFLSQKYEYVSADLLKKSYKGLLTIGEKKHESFVKPERTIMQVCNYKYSKLSALVKTGERSPNTLKRWKITKRKLRQFLQFKFGSCDVPLSLFKFSHADDFLHYLLTKHHIVKNTAMKYLKNTKELLKIAEGNEWRSNNPWSPFITTYKQPKRNCLTIYQIIAIFKKNLIGRLDHVRNVFLFACFTGYSFAELQNLTRDAVFIGIDGKKWIKIDRQKTNNPECLPLLPIPTSVIDRYINDPYCIENNKLLPLKSYTHYNGYLKEISSICNIDFELTTHVARHTFATTVCLDNGVPLETISKMLGHTNIRTTQIYAKISNRNLSVNMTMLERKLFCPEGNIKVTEIVQLLPKHFSTGLRDDTPESNLKLLVDKSLRKVNKDDK